MHFCTRVWMYVSILTRLSEQIRHTSPLMLSGNFSRGIVILSSTHSCTKVMFCLCSKSLFSQLAASTGETEHILQTSMRNTLTKQTTNSEQGYRNADNVSLFFFISFPLSPTRYYGIYHCLSFCLGYFLLFCVNVQKFPMGADGKKKILAAFHIDSPRLQDLESFCPPEHRLTFAFHYLSLSSSPSPFALPFTLFHQNFSKTGALWSPPMRWGQRCSRLKRTLQIEFTLDETNRFACVYPPETGWPAPGNELSHL